MAAVPRLSQSKLLAPVECVGLFAIGLGQALLGALARVAGVLAMVAWVFTGFHLGALLVALTLLGTGEALLKVRR